MKFYRKDQFVIITEVIKLRDEGKIRGKIKDTGDWISLKNIKTNYMWVEPYLDVRNLYFFFFVFFFFKCFQYVHRSSHSWIIYWMILP